MADPTDKLAKTIEDTKAFVDKANEKMENESGLADPRYDFKVTSLATQSAKRVF